MSPVRGFYATCGRVHLVATALLLACMSVLLLGEVGDPQGKGGYRGEHHRLRRRDGRSELPRGIPLLLRAFYRKPRYNRDGSPYGGQGQKVLYHHCAGTAAGSEACVYRFGGEVTRATASKGSWISN
jgi:hypothetical protein